MFLLLLDNLAVLWAFWHYRINTIYTNIVVEYKIHLHARRNKTEKLTKMLSLFPYAKAHPNKFKIFRQRTYIVYLSDR
jgi:hypothetical protein